MKTHIEPINSVSKKITVTFDSDFCKEAQCSVLNKLQKQVVLPGFRKGKVPQELLVKRYGDALQSEVQRELLMKALEHLEKEDKLHVIAVTKSDFSLQDKTQVLNLEVELHPEFELPDYCQLKLDEKKLEVTPEESRDFIERLQKQQASYEVVNRPVQEKDYVKLSYEGFVDGKPLDSYEGVPHLWLKQKSTWEEVSATDGTGIPEIVAGLKGMKADEAKEIEVTLPETFPVEALRGKIAIYKVIVQEVREVKLPKIDEEFLKKLKLNSAEELTSFTEKSIKSRKEQEYAAQQKQKISEFFIQSVLCELPNSWVQTETDKVLQEMVDLFASHGVKSGALEEQKVALFEKAQAIARDRLKLQLCFEKIARQENVQLESKDIERVLVQEAVQRHMAPQKLLQQAQKDEAVRKDLQSKAFQAKMINWLFDKLSK